MKMEAKLHQNAILTGYVDAFCLICESLLTVEDVINHIGKPIHKKNLDAAPYLEKYKGENIRKVKKGYYCEFCNLFITAALKVNLHIAEATHKQNKCAQVLKRIGNSIIAYDIILNENAWNGLIEDVCALCNTEFYDQNIHKTGLRHILKLIQKRVEFVDEKAIYRMVDEESYQCLTCNQLLALSTIETHFDEDNHKKLFQKCREGQSEHIFVQENDEKELQKLDQVQKVIENDKIGKEVHKKRQETPKPKQTKKKPNKSNINEGCNKNEPEFEIKTKVNETVELEKATPQVLKPNYDQNHNETEKDRPTLDESGNVALNMSEGHNKLNQAVVCYNPTENPKETPPTKDINDPVEFAKEHELTYNKGNDNAYCRLCSVRLPGTLRSMKEHVMGMKHKNKALATAPKVNIIKTNIPKRQMQYFVKDISAVKNIFVHDVILNDKLCLEWFSFMTITQTNVLRCQACEVNLAPEEILDHLDSSTHSNAMNVMPVVLNLDGEFVREIRPGLFHCGFCNLIVGAWEIVSIHLLCGDHKVNKYRAAARFREHLPALFVHHQRMAAERLWNSRFSLNRFL